MQVDLELIEIEADSENGGSYLRFYVASDAHARALAAWYLRDMTVELPGPKPADVLKIAGES